MAFTVAHMAAVLPFYRPNSRTYSLRWLQFDALLIGSMMPDLHYFSGLDDSFSRQSHEWVGLFTYNLPWGLLVFALWYWLLKPATWPLIQPFLKDFVIDNHKLSDIKDNINFNDKKLYIVGRTKISRLTIRLKKHLIYWLSVFFLPVVFGLILGAATHLVWDGITHADGFIAQHVDWLQYQLYIYPFNGTTISRLLQYLSSIVGLLALFWFVILYLKGKLIVSRNSNDQSTTSYSSMSPILRTKHSLLIISSIVIVSLLWSTKTILIWYPKLFSSPYTFAAKVSVSLIQSTGILFICYAIIYHLVRYLYLSRYKDY